MLYKFVKVIARVAIKFYCRDVWINNKELLKCTGPLLLASNHPNSFLDAILLCTLFDTPVYSLARGDAFKGTMLTKILLALKLLPVYRVSEGVENLEENYKTFERCKQVFKENGIVLIFSEGKCVNEWHLRPLKKGTARLAVSSWEDGISLKVLPVAINYSSFRKFGKNVKLYFGTCISLQDMNAGAGYGRSIQHFNALLSKQLKSSVYEIDKSEKTQIKKNFYVPQHWIKRVLLFVPSVAGWLVHAPLYIPVKRFVLKKLNSTDHYDSLMVAIFFISYPIYILLITLIVFLITHQVKYFLLPGLLPCTAWSYVQLKKQLD